MEETTNKEENLKDLVKKLVEQNQTIIETKQSKPWKLPFRGRVGKAAIKRGFATVQVIKNNGEIIFTKAGVDEDGCIDIDGFPRIATAEHRLTHKAKPFYIFKEWSMKPISLVEQMSQDEQEKMNIFGRRLVLARFQTAGIKPKGKGFGMIGWIVLGAIIIGAIYYLTKGGGKIF
jgi:hypothetical protein